MMLRVLATRTFSPAFEARRACQSRRRPGDEAEVGVFLDGRDGWPGVDGLRSAGLPLWCECIPTGLLWVGTMLHADDSLSRLLSYRGRGSDLGVLSSCLPHRDEG